MSQSTVYGSQANAMSIPTVQSYTFDLRSGLREAAKVGLSQLEDMMNDIGYGWLDGYMESIMESSSSRAPITELMKTPSRTQTVKKTRATTAAQKDRTEKVKGLNVRLNGSPMSKAVALPSRQPFSPLQPRSLNAAPQQVFSPSPLKGKGSTPAKKSGKAEKPKKEKKKGKSKKADENAPITSTHSSIEASQEDDHPMDTPMDGSTPKKSTATRARAPISEQVKSPRQKTTSIIPSISQQQDVPSLRTDPKLATSLSEIAPEAQPEGTEVEMGTAPSAPATTEEEAEAGETTMHATKSLVIVDMAKSTSDSTAQPTGPTEAFSPESIPVARSQAPAAQVNTGANVPVRQVRSSWLSKALGTGTVPVTGLPNSRPSVDAMSMRKSFAAPSSRINNTVEFGAVRKSMVPAGGLNGGTKRQSEEGLEEDKRPEKFFKTESQTQILPPRIDLLPKSAPVLQPTSHTPGPIFPAVSHTPAAALSVQPESVGQSAQSRGERGRSDIFKVTKALDELREKAAAKEAAAKARAALAASTGPRHTTSSELRQSTAGGSGFFKGLGSLGIGLGRSLGLGGTARSAEEEALRLQQELEEERREELEAQAKLDQLMAEADRPITPSLADDGHEPIVDNHIEFDSRDLVSSTPFVPRSDKGGKTMEVDEVEEEEEVAEELDELMEDDVEEPQAPSNPAPTATAPAPLSNSLRSPTPPRSQAPARQRTPPNRFQDIFASSTTPTATPPRTRPAFLVEAPALQARNEKHDRPEGIRPPPKVETQHAQIQAIVKSEKRPVPTQQKDQASSQTVRKVQEIRPSQPSSDDREEEEKIELPDLPEPVDADDERTDTEEEDDDLDEEVREMPAKKMFKSDTDAMTKQKLPSTTSYSNLTESRLNASTSSQMTNHGMFGHASTIAGKTLGFKPTTGPVKSLQLAAAAAKKEQAANDRKAQLREQAEQRKVEAARKKAEEDRIKAEEDKKIRAAELEEKRKIRQEAERRRKEREEKIAMIAREKAAKEEAEKAAAKAKADEEALQKRKLAQAALAKSANAAPKKIAQPATNAPMALVKPKEPLRTIKPTVTLTSASATSVNGMGGSKMGPTSFRTADNSQNQVTSTATSTISLVQQQPIRQFGQPSRPSQQPQAHAHGFPQASRASNVLQQSRVALQSQLDEKALEVQSEDIVLPDIASEYSDSDDSDKEPDFKRPAWAESPELRQALADQASRNPDELFGPIKPLNMEELFKQRTNKFRARTSSANWNGGDRLTRQEEVEYARRMGFKPLPPSGLGNGV